MFLRNVYLIRRFTAIYSSKLIGDFWVTLCSIVIYIMKLWTFYRVCIDFDSLCCLYSRLNLLSESSITDLQDLVLCTYKKYAFCVFEWLSMGFACYVYKLKIAVSHQIGHLWDISSDPVSPIKHLRLHSVEKATPPKSQTDANEIYEKAMDAARARGLLITLAR